MKLLRETIRRILLETFDSYDKLTKDENIELRMMEHSKDHINLENNVAIAKAFRYYSETSSMPLYRGVYNTETRILESLQIGDTFQLGRVTSLSESFRIAKRFAKLGNMIELEPGAEGCFSLVGLIVDDLNQWNQQLDEIENTFLTNPPEELRGVAKNRFYKLFHDPQKTAIEPFKRIGEDTYSSILDDYKSCPFNKSMYDNF